MCTSTLWDYCNDVSHEKTVVSRTKTHSRSKIVSKSERETAGAAWTALICRKEDSLETEPDALPMAVLESVSSSVLLQAVVARVTSTLAEGRVAKGLAGMLRAQMSIR